MEDIFQESLIVLMQNVKKGRVVSVREGAVFSYLVQIGKLTTCNVIRKKRIHTQEEIAAISANLHKEMADFEMTVSEKQQTQNEFLDRAFDSLPDTCKTIFKKYYWERRPFDEISDIIGFGSVDSVKTKKSRCMKKFVDFAKKLIENDEFAEEAVRDSAERAALRALINEERVYAETGVAQAALDLEEDSDKDC
ncbi:MAG: RNA polymerase sigma factor [Candidatus Cryptobacteroides sp.]